MPELHAKIEISEEEWKYLQFSPLTLHQLATIWDVPFTMETPVIILVRWLIHAQRAYLEKKKNYPTDIRAVVARLHRKDKKS